MSESGGGESNTAEEVEWVLGIGANYYHYARAEPALCPLPTSHTGYLLKRTVDAALAGIACRKLTLSPAAPCRICTAKSRRRNRFAMRAEFEFPARCHDVAELFYPIWHILFPLLFSFFFLLRCNRSHVEGSENEKSSTFHRAPRTIVISLRLRSMKFQMGIRTDGSYEVCIRVCVTLIDVGPSEVDIACPQGPFVTTWRRRKCTIPGALISPDVLGTLSRWCIKFRYLLTSFMLLTLIK